MTTSTLRREILMPRVVPSMADGRIERWHVAEGQSVAAGDVLAEIATASATMEIEAKAEGRIERILVPAGTAGVKVNTPIAILLDEAQGASSPGSTHAAPNFFMAAGAMSPLAAVEDLPTYREALRDALAHEMRRDASVFVLGSDVAQNRGAQKVTQGLLDEFGPARVVSSPPLDDAVFGLAIGAALRGLRPVVEITSWAKASEALEAVLATAASAHYVAGGAVSVPIVFRGPDGLEPGVPGADGRCMASSLAQVPGLKVVIPATPATASGLLKAAIRDGGPVAVLEHSALYGTRGPVEAGEGDEIYPIGRARVAREGSDLTIVTYGRGVSLAVDAAFVLEGEGISAEVVDLMSLRPLDIETVIASVRKTGRLVTVEEGLPQGGIGAEIIASVTSAAFEALKAAPVRLAGEDVPMPYAEALQERAVPTVDTILAAARAVSRVR
jgi:pyruvate dehydrogenase E1 component beta subunit